MGGVKGQNLSDRIVLIFFFVATCFSVLLSAIFGGKIAYREIEPLVNVAQNMSAMVFTIMGVWVACAYPLVMAQIVGGADNIESIFSGSDYKRIKRVISVVCFSALNMFLVMVFIALKPVISKMGCYSEYVQAFKIFGMFYVLMLITIQCACMLIVLFANLDFLINLMVHEKKRCLDRKLIPTTKSGHPKND